MNRKPIAWLHCNTCLIRKVQIDSGPKLFCSTCFHVFCEQCRHPTTSCPKCQQKCRWLEINSGMPTNLALFFEDWQTLVPKVQRIVRFQFEQFINFQQQSMQRLQKYQKDEQEYQNLLKIKQKLVDAIHDEKQLIKVAKEKFKRMKTKTEPGPKRDNLNFSLSSYTGSNVHSTRTTNSASSHSWRSHTNNSSNSISPISIPEIQTQHRLQTSLPSVHRRSHNAKAQLLIDQAYMMAKL